MSSLEDIPKPLTRLIRLILGGFYNIEHKLVIDMLVRRKETKEDDLVEVLKLERKHLRSLIQHLRNDKFINVRLIMETDEDGKSTRRNYYSINYRMFVNVVKYKIDHMRRKLETEERDLTSRASFICTNNRCSKKFTDLDTNQILDSRTGQLRCSHCDGDVEEDPNNRRQDDSRDVMVKFNKQMEPVYSLLQETENIKWHINEADRSNMTAANVGVTTNGTGTSNNETSHTNNGTSSDDPQNQGPNSNPNPQDNYLVKINGLEEKAKDQKRSEPIINPEIESLLLREESLANQSTPVQDGFQDGDESDDPLLTVQVGQSAIAVDQISDEHVAMMTPQQRVDYEKTMQRVYSLLYD